MRIFLHAPYKSLVPFSAISLPSFAVLVGLNGTGKSQLLEALETRRAGCSAMSDTKLDEHLSHPGIVRLTNSSLNLKSDMLVKSATPSQLSKAVFHEHREQIFKNHEHTIRTNFPNAFKNGETIDDILPIRTTDELVSGPDGNNDLTKHAVLRAVLARLNEALGSAHYASRHAPAKDAFARYNAAKLGEARLVTYEDLMTFGSWGEHGMFDSQLTRLFGGYRDEVLRNDNLAPRSGSPPRDGWLDAVAFEEMFGSPPWDHLSSILASFNLNYRIAPPGSRAIDPVVLYFERMDDNRTHVDFGELSAGEKVLVILAVALMNVDPVRAVMRRPELLLLDEIDASLHPAVLHQWLSTIQEKVVGELGIPCILTTHSPVTVAFTPEDALFEMSRSILRSGTIERDISKRASSGVNATVTGECVVYAGRRSF